MRKAPLLLVGYGRFGAFAAVHLKRSFEVHVLDSRRGLRLAAGLKRARPADIREFDILLLALPATRLEKFLKSNGRRIRDGAFVADLCAVKSAPLGWMRRYLPGGVSYAGLHPLFGPSSAATGLRGHRVVVCRGRATAACRKRLLGWIRRFGLEPVETDPATHDRAMASTLFLTQIVGNLLPGPGHSAPPFGTPSSESLRRVVETARGNSPALLPELLTYNRFCRAALRRLERRFSMKFGTLLKFSPEH
jgi:prephenate dehydrogenase